MILTAKLYSVINVKKNATTASSDCNTATGTSGYNNRWTNNARKNDPYGRRLLRQC